jgi:hypothetical protein
VPPAVRQYGRSKLDRLAYLRLQAMCCSRSDFIADLRSAVEDRRGYAAGKIGASQKTWMYYPIFLTKRYSKETVANYERELRYHCLQQEGVFPDSLDFYLEFARFYVDHVRNLDSLGICLRDTSQELEIIRSYRLNKGLIYYPLQEPDRSVPSDDANCYLQFLAGKKLLIVCPFAGLLQKRARRDVFEAVWRKTGKKWFEPASVDGLELP